MNAQKELLKAGGSILALAGTISKLRAKFNSNKHNQAKKKYNETVNIKKQNSELAKKQIEAIEQKELAKEAPKEFGIETLIDEKHDEQKLAEKKVQGFGELISAESSETKIPANDPDVQGLIKVKEKSAKRSLAASKAQKAYHASKGYEKDFPIRDYLPNVNDKDLKKAGITKTELNKLSSIIAGNGKLGELEDWFDKHGGDGAAAAALIGEGEIDVTERTAGAIKTLILDKNKLEEADIEAENKESQVDDWYTNFNRNNSKMTGTYKVWQDEPKEEIKTDRNFSGFVF